MWVKIFQMTFWVIPDAFVDDDLHEDLLILALLTRGVIEMVKGHEEGTWRGNPL